MCRETNFCGHKRREEQWRKAQGKRDSFVLGFYGIHVARGDVPRRGEKERFAARSSAWLGSILMTTRDLCS